MAAVAFIEEKRFNLAVGLVSGALTVLAASKAQLIPAVQWQRIYVRGCYGETERSAAAKCHMHLQ